MIENKIELKSIRNLLGMNFFIPSYQRGYRWTRQQVMDLLEDIWEFEPKEFITNDGKTEKTWYCLQPLVVKCNSNKTISDDYFESKAYYEVIDGQQRLTTMYIILNCLNQEKNVLQYVTRKELKDFLKDIAGKTKATNIDFHYMLEAKNTIEDWIRDKTLDSFIEKLKENCRVIWYQISETDNAYEVFKRLNSGKISLSNAELIKAMLLKKENFAITSDNEIRLQQLEMAGEWDRIEQALHNDSFWYFINGDPENQKFEATRIDYIFELILRKESKEKSFYKGKENYEKGRERNDYYAFYEFSNYLANKENDRAYLELWCEIKSTYRILKGWYDDRELYHFVGYLMNQRGENKQIILPDLLEKYKIKGKTDFKNHLKEECCKILKIDKAGKVNFLDFQSKGVK